MARNWSGRYILKKETESANMLKGSGSPILQEPDRHAWNQVAFLERANGRWQLSRSWTRRTYSVEVAPWWLWTQAREDAGRR